MIDGHTSEGADLQETAHPSANPEEWSTGQFKISQSIAQLLKARPSVFE